jgi:hypothetical protein
VGEERGELRKWWWWWWWWTGGGAAGVEGWEIWEEEDLGFGLGEKEKLGLLGLIWPAIVQFGADAFLENSSFLFF